MAPAVGSGQAAERGSGITSAAISHGSIIIGDKDNQIQDIAGLSRDTANAHQGVGVSGAVQKVRDSLAAQSEGMALGVAALDVYGKYAEQKARESNTALAARLTAEGRMEGKTAQEREAYLKSQPGYQGTDYGPGSEFWTKGSAAAGLLAGALGGNLKAGAAAGAAPLLASLVRDVQNDAARAALHGIVAAALTELGGGHGGDGLKAGAAGAVTASLAGPRLVRALYGKEDMDGLSPDEKRLVSNLVSVIGGIAGYTAGDTDIAMAAIGANAARVEVENNLLGATSSDKLEKVIEKIKNGDKTLATANDLIKLENADKRSDALISKYLKDPSQMSSAEQAELATYLRIYASEMEKEYGQAVSQELVKGVLSGQDYIKRNPDSEAMAKAQNIMNTWGYHKSNASIGDSPVMFGGSVLGLTVKGMAANAAIGVGVNSAAQLTGKDPFSYVDAIMAGVTAAATTGKGIIVSTPINMGGAAIGSSIKGEEPTNSVIGTGLGSLFGGGMGKIISGSMGSSVKEGTSDIISNIGGSITSETIGNVTKGTLDEADKSIKK
ncbi:hypothetical protein KB20921_27140 [Edwardsiella ictaluri]|nr:hypothetical protein KH20906_27000 [Edwardsiella ictaluri]BEI03453.1 hypothetical protein KB20921_27140 [Edwardsiella ictaluri]BEI06914.1 hypothetical protein KH201010_27000 [Edwardsiella ictaluri]BEI13860.1 hypothetical protein STU22816_27130 [Edwardsiella ictaluri]BEI17333.1 hypothetical protein STA22820_27060 [Edwardsiella ictaluri]